MIHDLRTKFTRIEYQEHWFLIDGLLGVAHFNPTKLKIVGFHQAKMLSMVTNGLDINRASTNVVDIDKFAPGLVKYYIQFHVKRRNTSTKIHYALIDSFDFDMDIPEYNGGDSIRFKISEFICVFEKETFSVKSFSNDYDKYYIEMPLSDFTDNPKICKLVDDFNSRMANKLQASQIGDLTDNDISIQLESVFADNLYSYLVKLDSRSRPIEHFINFMSNPGVNDSYFKVIDHLYNITGFTNWYQFQKRTNSQTKVASNLYNLINVTNHRG